MIRKGNRAVLLMVALALSGCNSDCMKAKTEEMRTLLENKLKIGDTRGKVDVVLKKAGIAYSYDRFQNRYQSTIYNSKCGDDKATSIYIYFTTSGRMQKIEVRETYTWW